MNFLEMEKDTEGKKGSHPTRISIGGELSAFQEVTRIDYQNSLVMKSLQEYNIKFEQLKKEQTELLKNIKNQAENLKESNDILNEKMEDTLKKFSNIQRVKIMTILDNANSILSVTKTSLNQGLDGYLKKINDENEDFLSKCEERKRKLFKQWTIIDYLILADLLIIPIATAILVYKVFFVK